METFTEQTVKLKTISPLEWKPYYTVRFYANGKEIGCFDFSKSPATFTGDIDESAKLFVDQVIRTWSMTQI